MVGFQKDVENKLAAPDTLFEFLENLKEATIFRFIKLVSCNNKHVGEFSRFVSLSLLAVRTLFSEIEVAYESEDA